MGVVCCSKTWICDLGLPPKHRDSKCAFGFSCARHAFNFSIPLPLTSLKREADTGSSFKSPGTCHLTSKRRWEGANSSGCQFLLPHFNV
jgi:hypothetical protein